MNINLKKKDLLDLRKDAKEAIETKAIGKSQVVAVFDISGSMEDFYRKGIVADLATRVLALGLELDDDGQVPVYTLGDSSSKLKNLTEENLADYVKKEIMKLVGTGTNYAPVINKIINDAPKSGDPMLVLIFTDGDNWDKKEAEEAIVRASNLPIFFQWYGIYGSRNPGFGFLEKLNDLNNRDLKIDNCGFSPLSLTSGQGEDTDAALYEDMLKEYKEFPKKAAEADVKWGNQAELPRRRRFGIF